MLAVIFSPFESYSEYLAQFFHIIIRVSTVECKKLLDSFNLSHELKFDKLELVFQNRNSGYCSYFLMNNEHNLTPQIFFHDYRVII